MIEPPSVKEQLGSVMCPIFGPVVFGAVPATSYLLQSFDAENIMPSLVTAANVSAGQGMELDENGDLMPSDGAITDDPFTELDGSSDLQFTA